MINVIKLRIGVYLGLMILIISSGLGCASTHKTTTTETTVTHQNETVGAVGSIPDDHVVETSETTTTIDKEAEHPGIISSTLHAVGYVIVLPFKILGSVFRMLFGG